MKTLPASYIRESNQYSTPKQRVSTIKCPSESIKFIFPSCHRLTYLCRQYNSHDYTVNCHRLAENDTSLKFSYEDNARYVPD